MRVKFVPILWFFFVCFFSSDPERVSNKHFRRYGLSGGGIDVDRVDAGSGCSDDPLGSPGTEPSPSRRAHPTFRMTAVTRSRDAGALASIVALVLTFSKIALLRQRLSWNDNNVNNDYQRHS